MSAVWSAAPSGSLSAAAPGETLSLDGVAGGRPVGVCGTRSRSLSLLLSRSRALRGGDGEVSMFRSGLRLPPRRVDLSGGSMIGSQPPLLAGIVKRNWRVTHGSRLDAIQQGADRTNLGSVHKTHTLYSSDKVIECAEPGA